MTTKRIRTERPIVLTTDFGLRDTYAGIMKGVMLGINPRATIVDLCHDIPPQDVFAGAFVLLTAFPYFPPGTIFVAVVDPGVGTDRKMICVETENFTYVAPDNGILGPACKRQKVLKVAHVNNREYFLPNPSNTFHGRDIMAPVAARLSLGMSPEDFGPLLQGFEGLEIPSPTVKNKQIIGEVIYVDRFGNLVTNITAETLKKCSAAKLDNLLIEIGNYEMAGISQTYHQETAGKKVSLFGSSGFLEIAVCDGNAARELNLQRGSSVIIKI